MVRAFGTFERNGDYIYRTKARLEWGTSKQIMGLIIMLNPGSSKTLSQELWEKFQRKEIERIEDAELIVDPTMKAVIEILEEYNPSLNGVLHIANLFNLRESDKKEAFKNYYEISKDNIFLYSVITNEYLSQFPWIWIAWGVDNGVINSRKITIVNQIPKEKLCFKIYTKDKRYLNADPKIHFLHPLPKRRDDQLLYKTEIVSLMQSSL